MTQESPPPDQGTVRFLAPAADPRQGKEGTTYGPGHITTFNSTDYDFVKDLWLDGKAEILEMPRNPAEFLAPPLPA